MRRRRAETSGEIGEGGLNVFGLSAASGSGVDSIHVRALPVGGGSPVFAGAATDGTPRPDVAAVLGGQFANAGYAISVARPTGAYDLVVYAHSPITGTFNQSRAVRITISP